ncbi:MAG: zinc ABC transporter substrate-binding protein [Hyphomicrobium sp.]|nr:MAG: zinc ABC transporter substrate-binding protein [Hyphomicrobium sp.]
MIVFDRLGLHRSTFYPRAQLPSLLTHTWLAAAFALVLSSGPLGAAELKVTVTSKPIHSLIASVMGATGQPKLLVDGNASPHTYAMKPSDSKAVQDAAVFFRVSEGLEPFTAKLVKSLPKTVRVVSLQEAPDLTLLDRRQGGTFEAHSDAKKPGHGHSHAHDHGDEQTGGVDPHVWLDPANARKMTNHIAAILSAANPADAATYKANAEAHSATIAALTAELETELAPVKGRPFVVFHDAYQYFERHFGLTAAGSITVSPDVQPSARRLTAIRQKIGQLGATCVFAEPQFKSKLIDTVIEGTKARPGTLDPEGGLIPAGPDLYSTLMRSLAGGLKDCLARSS